MVLRCSFRLDWPVELVEGRSPNRLDDPDDLDNETSVWPRLFNALSNSYSSGNGPSEMVHV